MVAKHVNKTMAGTRRVLAVNALLLSLAALGAAFQCCSFLLSLLKMQSLRKRQLVVQSRQHDDGVPQGGTPITSDGVDGRIF